MKITYEPVVTIECEDIMCGGITCTNCPIYQRTQSDRIKLTSEEAINFILNNVISMKIKTVDSKECEENNVL